jgi:hypothetical protein
LIILFILRAENESKPLEQEETNSTAHSHRMLAWVSVNSYSSFVFLAYRFVVSLDSKFFPEPRHPFFISQAKVGIVGAINDIDITNFVQEMFPELFPNLGVIFA